MACHAYVFITGRIASCQRAAPTSSSSITLTEKSLFTYDQNDGELRFSFRSFMIKNKKQNIIYNHKWYMLHINNRSNGHRHVHTEQKKNVPLSIHSTIHMVQHEVSWAHWLLPLLNSVSSISVSKFWLWSAPACFTKTGIYCYWVKVCSSSSCSLLTPRPRQHTWFWRMARGWKGFPLGMMPL